jgi:hypothetical protein
MSALDVGWPWNRVILICLVVFMVLYALALWVVREREIACAESCAAKGFAGYEYKGFSPGTQYGPGPDRCTCSGVPRFSASPPSK